MKSCELKEDRIIKRWLSGRKAAEKTRKSYLQAMQAFTEYTGKTPEELLLEAEAEIKAGLLMRERNIDSYMLGFREELESKGLAPLTVKSRMSGVSSFYTNYNIQLPIIPRSTQKAKPELKRKKIPTKDDIREILTLCNPLEKALILVGISSGLSVADICNLKVSDFAEGFDNENGITTLHLVRKKMNYEFYTFLSPEASKSVQDYLEWRNRKGKNENTRRNNQLKKQNVTTNDGYLFISQMVPDEYLTIKREKEREELRKFKEPSIMAIYRRLNEEARKSAPSGEYNLIRSHNMRRFFNSSLLAGKAPIFFVDFLLGHQLDATHEAYFRADPKSLREEYIKYLPYITIEKALDPEQHPDFIRLKKESETYARAAAIATVERSELIELREVVEKMKEDDRLRDELLASMNPKQNSKFMELFQEESKRN